MKRRTWMLGGFVALAVLIAGGLCAFAQSLPVPGGAGGAAAVVPSEPAGGAPSRPAGAETASEPTSEPLPGPEDEMEPEPTDTGTQPATGPGATSGPARGGIASSRPAFGSTGYTRTATSYPAYGSNFGTRTRNGGNTGNTGRTDRTGRTRGGSGAEATTTPPPVFGPSTSWDNFSVVATRNIFIKDRSVRERIGPPPPPPPPPGGYTLTGTIEVESNQPQNSDLIGFLEEVGTGQQIRVVTGSVVAGGRVTRVAIDGIEYEKSGVRRWVGPGQSLSGGRIDMAIQPTLASPDTPGATSTSAPAEGGGDSVLERLRRRRQQELR